jgi:hypothetical protein
MLLRKAGLLALVLALALLASGAAHAAPLAGSARTSESHGIVDRFWEWFESFFRSGGPSPGQVKSVWEQEGSHADPNGES